MVNNKERLIDLTIGDISVENADKLHVILPLIEARDWESAIALINLWGNEQITISAQSLEQDAIRTDEMLAAISSHDWDAASSLVSDWSMQDEPDWEDIPDPFDKGIQFNALREAFE